MSASVGWWAWVLIAFMCWFIQLMMSVWTDKGGFGAWTVRIAFIAGMVMSFLLGAIRFAKWAWQG